MRAHIAEYVTNLKYIIRKHESRHQKNSLFTCCDPEDKTRG